MRIFISLGFLVVLILTSCFLVLSQTADPVFVGAGDIAGCNDPHSEGGPLSTAQLTSNLLDGISGTVFAVGDLGYPDGSEGEFTKCYDQTWGRHRWRTMPVPGNHEYNTPNGSDYFNYFGPVAGDPTKGYYSFNLGAWHIIALNTNSLCSTISCATGSAQANWLQADLSANPATCTLAYWHHPLYSSTASATTAVKPFWQLLYNAKAELVINGHAHVYERFAPQDPNGNLDTTNGIVEIVAGTGGDSHHPFGTTAPNSLVQNNTTYGVLKLTLHATSYDWQFVPVAGKTFTDSGTASCH
jgi:calcineurin-like phosphoesterase family protein